MPSLRPARLLALLVAVPMALNAPAEAAAGDARHTWTERTGAADWARGRRERTTVDAAGRLQMGPSTKTTTVAGTSYLWSRWTSDWITPGHEFTEVIASWRASTPAGSHVSIALQVRRADGSASSWDSIARWSSRDADFKRSSGTAQRDDLARVAVDTLVANSGSFTSWRVRVGLARTASAKSPALTSVGAVASQLPSTLPATSTPSNLVGTTLAVPQYSQMRHRGHFTQYAGGGANWCSPTSLSMLLGYYGRLPSAANTSWTGADHPDPWVDHTARLVHDKRADITGNWGFNTAYAGIYLAQARVTRLASLREAERLIAAGIPLAASIRFDRGGLTGAPISSTPGHILVIVGFTAAGDVVVNDPAAASNAGVRRTYDRAQFERAWQRGSHGVVYLVADDAHPLPPRGTSRAW